MVACWNALVPGVVVTDNAGPGPVLKVPKENYFAISNSFLAESHQESIIDNSNPHFDCCFYLDLWEYGHEPSLCTECPEWGLCSQCAAN